MLDFKNKLDFNIISDAGNTDDMQQSDKQIVIDIVRDMLIASSSPNGTVLKASRQLTSAEILALYTTPIEIVPAVAGKYIEVVSASIQIVAGIPYQSETYINLGNDISDREQAFCSILDSPTSRIINFNKDADFAVNTPQIFENKALLIKTYSPPTVGTGIIKVTVLYTINDLAVLS